tara:strand:+ start:617 stop:928 length:312 start_codon:yes stop_codon:yes gene_type:complete
MGRRPSARRERKKDEARPLGGWVKNGSLFSDFSKAFVANKINNHLVDSLLNGPKSTRSNSVIPSVTPLLLLLLILLLLLLELLLLLVRLLLGAATRRRCGGLR